MSACFCTCVHIRKMLRDSCMCIKAVDHVEIFCTFRCLLRKIGCASAAQNHNIDFILPVCHVLYVAHLGCLVLNNQFIRISSCEYGNEFHIIVLVDGCFYAAAEISVSVNSDSRHFVFLLILSPCMRTSTLSPSYSGFSFYADALSLTSAHSRH